VRELRDELGFLGEELFLGLYISLCLPGDPLTPGALHEGFRLT
jgi:hypothetical protein